MDNNIQSIDEIMINLRCLFESEHELQDPVNRLSNLMLIAKNLNPDSVLVQHKKNIQPIIYANLEIRSGLVKKNQSYEQLIDSLYLSDYDKSILKSFIFDLTWLLPIGGNLSDPLPETKPNSKIISSWKDVVMILTLALAIGPAIQPFVDLKIHIDDKKQNQIENKFREKEIELEVIEQKQKERELDIKEGKINLPDKNNDTFY